MKKLTLVAFAFAFSLLQPGFTANAGVVLYDGLAGDDFFGATPGGFTFDDFGGGQVTNSGNSLIIDTATEVSAGNGLFGGVGRDLAAPFDFDPEDTSSFFRLEYRVLSTNAAANFNIVLRDQDDADSAQDFQYFVDPSFRALLTDGSGFSEQFVPINQAASVFSQVPGGFTDGGDGVANYGLSQWQIQSQFGSNDRLSIEVRFAEIVTATAIPEPGSFALIAAMSCTLVARRRRK